MNRNISCYSITGYPNIKQQILNWVNQFSVCCFLDNHQYNSPNQNIECLAAAKSIFTISGDNALNAINTFYQTHTDWLFGHINYEYNPSTQSTNKSFNNQIGFDQISFFQPETVLRLNGDSLFIETFLPSTDLVFQEIINANDIIYEEKFNVKTTPSISKEQYVQTIQQLLKHIQRGDCYEINFCQEFFAENTIINPIQLYTALTTLSPNPFACYYKQQDAHLLCASPERYLQRKGNQIISQPIKGTAKRNTKDPLLDAALKDQLYNSSKERSENVMVVDLVRNDLSKICKEGTVEVEELFGIYTFPQVHQMISTIKGILKDDTLFSEIINASFPMGSMTGAPKKRVMELIQQYEAATRGIYSGAVGYINPQQNFDFNVVIRSLLYNSSNKYLSYWVGSGITGYSNPEEEYDECILKAAAMNTVLQN